MLNAIYGAQRGPILPEGHVDVGATWKTTLPIPSTAGFAGEVHYDYTYARKADGVAVIGCDRRFEGKRPQGAAMQKLSGTSSAEYRFDIARRAHARLERRSDDAGRRGDRRQADAAARRAPAHPRRVDLDADDNKEPTQ